MSKTIIGTFNVKTPDELAKDRLICEKRKAAKEAAALKRKAAKEKAEAMRLAKTEKEHRSYVIRMTIFISISVVIFILFVLCILIPLLESHMGDEFLIKFVVFIFLLIYMLLLRGLFSLFNLNK